MTTKRAALEREYKKVWREILEERDHSCAGCGKWGGRLTPSHRIHRSRNISLLAKKKKIDIICPDCAGLVETGKWSFLNNGRDVLEYIREMEPSYCHQKITKNLGNIHLLTNLELLGIQHETIGMDLTNLETNDALYLLEIENEIMKRDSN